MPKPFDLNEFTMIDTFIAGFHQKLLQDEVPAGAAVRQSVNFSLDDDGKWRTRPGSEFLGTLDAQTAASTAAGKIRRRDGFEIPVVSYGTRVKYWHPNTSPRRWAVLEAGLTNGAVMGFGSNDISSNNVNHLVMSNARDSYRLWNGATAIVASVTATTIVVQGSTTLANLGFTASGSVSVEGVNYAYTSIAAQTFSGVTPDPSAAGVANNDALTQLPVGYGSNPLGNVVLVSDRARVLVGHVRPSANFVGGGALYGSAIDNPADFTFSSPRVAAQGFILNIAEGGETITGLAQFENVHYVFKPNCIKQITFSQDNNDVVQSQSLSSYDEKGSSDDGSISHLAVFRGADSIVFVSPTNTINTIRRVAQFDYPQRLPISDPIKNYCETAVFNANTAGISWRGRIFIAARKNSDSTINDIILVYNERFGAWETPIEGLNIADFFIFGGNLYGALATQPDIVRIWTGTRDFVHPTNDDIPINSELRLARQNFGSKHARKEFDRVYLEGEMTQTGSVTFELEYNEGGATRQVTITGTESGFFFSSTPSGSFGSEEFGIETFGPSSPSLVSGSDPVRFRVILTTKILPFYNVQPRFRTSNYFKLIACGANVRKSRFVHPPSTYKALQ